MKTERPRSLLLLNYEYPPLGGGAANATFFMARALARLGHRVTVLTSALGEASTSREEDRIIVHRLKVGRDRPDRGTVAEMCRYMFSAARRIRRIAAAEEIDAAIAFFTIPSGPIAYWLNCQRNVPYVISLAGSDVPGHDPTLDSMHRLTQPLRRAAMGRANAVVANSEGLAATSRAADPFPVQIIANGIAQDVFHPPADRAAPAPGETLRLLFVGRVHREKNLGVVLDQLAALPEPFRRRLQLDVVGDGAQQPELAARAAALDLAAQVRWLGWQAKSAMPALYRTADAFVLPSLYEGMSNAALEAMASGLPVFASDVPGNRAVVQPGRTGALFPLQRPQELGEILLRFARDPHWGRTLGANARQWIEAEFSWEKAARLYLDLLGPGALVARPV